MVPAIPALGLLLVLGALVGALWAMRDRLLRARKDLRASKTRHSAILRALPDLMFVFSRDGVYVDFCERLQRALYLTRTIHRPSSEGRDAPRARAPV
jgi:PAS domain-containing protein